MPLARHAVERRLSLLQKPGLIVPEIAAGSLALILPSEQPIFVQEIGLSLDLYSTSATSPAFGLETCANHAPLIVYPKETSNGKTWQIAQGCCNDWRCPRCGLIRAKQEYWRMVNGAVELAAKGIPLYALTVTCKGKEMPLAASERDYGLWTKRLNDAIRIYAKRNDLPYYFAAVTERQKRGHPHSHYVTSICPLDAGEYVKVEKHRRPDGILAIKPSREVHLWSDWLAERVESAGFGPQHDLTRIRDSRAASRYFAKYLFKASATDTWPPGWKRIRYSQSWPKPEEVSSPEAFPIIKPQDWTRVQALSERVVTNDPMIYEMALHRVTNVVFKQIS